MTQSKESELRQLGELVGKHDALVYKAVKQGKVDSLSRDGQLKAKAIQDHLHLPHVHNALAFAAEREGERYEIEVDGEPVSPLAHIAFHAAVEGQIVEDENVRAALEKLLAVGVGRHHAIHILMEPLMKFFFEATSAYEKGDQMIEKHEHARRRHIKKLVRDSAFRKKQVRQSSSRHSWAPDIDNP